MSENPICADIANTAPRIVRLVVQDVVALGEVDDRPRIGVGMRVARGTVELQLAQQRVERVLRIDGAKPTDEVGQCFAVRVQIGLQELLVLVGEIRDLAHRLARRFAVRDVEHPVVVDPFIGDVHAVAAHADAHGGTQHDIRPDPAAFQRAAT